MKYLIPLLTLAFLVGCETTPPVVQTGTNAEVTFDGLHRVDGSYMQYVWVKPNLSLAGYTKIKLASAGIAYREVKQVSHANTGATEFPLTEKQKATLESLVQETFRDELGKSEHFTLVSESGSDVLMLTGGLLDVVSAIPPERAGRSDYYISRVGSAKLVLEIRDSRSNEILARAVDGRSVTPVNMQKSYPGSNAMEVKREFRKWGKRLTEALDQLHNAQM